MQRSRHLLLATLLLFTAACASTPRPGAQVMAPSRGSMLSEVSELVVLDADAVAVPEDVPEESGVVELVIDDEQWPAPQDWQAAAAEEDAAWPARVSPETEREPVAQVSLRVPDRLPGITPDPMALDDVPGLPPADLRAAESGAQSLLAALDPLDDVHYDLPVEVNEAVHTYLEYFQTRMRPTFARYLIRAGRYIPGMKEVFREYGLPEDLVYVALIESGFNPYAYSRASAAGPWQFIASTGKRYGLRQDYWVDERRDAILATHAAARYFTDLHQRFGDWFLAMAAYNSGEGRVGLALQRTGLSTFWELREAHALPQETRDYVPKFLAAAIIAKSPEEYGFYVEEHTPIDVATVEVEGPTSLSAIARATQLPVEEIEFLNPQLRRGLTPPDTGPYPVVLPRGREGLFAAYFPAIRDEEAELWARKAAHSADGGGSGGGSSGNGGHLVRHKVRTGESLSLIARKYSASVAGIQHANNMGRSTVIHIGQTVLVPTGMQVAGAGAEGVAAPVRYRVRNGDSLWKIAARHNVSVKDLLAWNNLKSGSVLRPGDRLVVRAQGS